MLTEQRGILGEPPWAAVRGERSMEKSTPLILQKAPYQSDTLDSALCSTRRGFPYGVRNAWGKLYSRISASRGQSGGPCTVKGQHLRQADTEKVNQSELVELQKQDPALKTVVSFLEHGTLSDDENVAQKIALAGSHFTLDP